MLLFSVYPTVVDVIIEVTKNNFLGLSSVGAYGSQYGYSVVNFSDLSIICQTYLFYKQSFKFVTKGVNG